MANCTRCRSPLDGMYGLVRIDDPWNERDVRAELCPDCTRAVWECLHGVGPTEPAPAPEPLEAA